MQLSDTALILRCQERDPSAFDEIVSRYKQKIFNYVYRMTSNVEEAEDITQDVFLKMYVSLPRFRSESSITTWLYRIAGNQSIDRYRKKRRRETALGGELLSLNTSDSGVDHQSSSNYDVADTSAEPSLLLMRGELGAEIQKALEKLPSKMRSVIILHDIEGLGYEEIALVEDCPLGTVKSRLFNARLQMRKNLSAYLRAY